MKALSFVRRRSCTAASVLTILTGLGCNELPKQAVHQLQQANQSYRNARYDQSERWSGQVIRAHPEKPDTAEAYYLRALARLKTKRRSLAEGDLLAASRRCGRPDLEVLICVQLGNMAFEDAKYARAASMYGRAGDELPTGMRADEVWYRHALSLQRSGRFTDAERAFRRLLRGHPTSGYAAAASAKLAWKHKYCTVQCGAFAQEDRARVAAAELRRRGIDSVSLAVRQWAELPYVVYAGRFRDYESAQSALSSIRRIQADAFVVP